MTPPPFTEDSLTARLVNGLLTELVAPVPGPLLRASERALLDFIGCARGATARDSTQLKPGSSAETLAGALGVLGSTLDRDDLHLPSLTHPGSVIWPTVLALGSELGASGDELLRAAIVGYEIVGRVASALGGEHRRYWHATATAGVIGASAAAALILRLEPPEVVSAVGHATSIAGGSSQCLVEGSGTKLVHRASAAVSGVLAARCAEAGIPATRSGLEGERALFAATSSLASAGNVLSNGERWVIDEMVNRYYASSGFCHAAIEAAANLASHSLDSIHRVQITLPAAVIPVVGATTPTTPAEAWWSAPYAVAVTLLYGSSQLESATLLNDDAVSRILTQTTVVSGKDDVSIVAVNGRECTRSIYKGHPEVPLTIEELIEKCQRLNPGTESSWDHLNIAGSPPGIATRLTDFIYQRAQGT